MRYCLKKLLSKGNPSGPVKVRPRDRLTPYAHVPSCISFVLWSCLSYGAVFSGSLWLLHCYIGNISGFCTWFGVACSHFAHDSYMLIRMARWLWARHRPTVSDKFMQYDKIRDWSMFDHLHGSLEKNSSNNKLEHRNENMFWYISWWIEECSRNGGK